jgi:hypothetical protein
MSKELTPSSGDPSTLRKEIEEKLGVKSAPIEKQILEGLLSSDKRFDGFIEGSMLNSVFENLTYSILLEEQDSIKKLVRASSVVFRVISETRFEQVRDSKTREVKQRLVVGNNIEIAYPRNDHFRSFTVGFSFTDDKSSCSLKLENDHIDVDIVGGRFEKLSGSLIAGKVRKRVSTPCRVIQESLSDRLRGFYGYTGEIKNVRLDLGRAGQLHTVISAV